VDGLNQSSNFYGKSISRKCTPSSVLKYYSNVNLLPRSCTSKNWNWDVCPPRWPKSNGAPGHYVIFNLQLRHLSLSTAVQWHHTHTWR